MILLIKLNAIKWKRAYLPCGLPYTHCYRWCCNAKMRSCCHWWGFWRPDSLECDHTTLDIALACSLGATLDLPRMDMTVGMLLDIQQESLSMAAIHNRIAEAKWIQMEKYVKSRSFELTHCCINYPRLFEFHLMVYMMEFFFPNSQHILRICITILNFIIVIFNIQNSVNCQVFG